MLRAFTINADRGHQQQVLAQVDAIDLHRQQI
jgi:hypothetical protein